MSNMDHIGISDILILIGDPKPTKTGKQKMYEEMNITRMMVCHQGIPTPLNTWSCLISE